MAEVQRYGMVIGVKDERIDDYKAVHADDHAGIRDLLEAVNMRNFSIFMQRLPDGDHYLFGYYEYVGADYEADMARLAAEPRNRAWLADTDAMQVPLPGADSWTLMERVYYNP